MLPLHGRCDYFVVSTLISICMYFRGMQTTHVSKFHQNLHIHIYVCTYACMCMFIPCIPVSFKPTRNQLGTIARDVLKNLQELLVLLPVSLQQHIHTYIPCTRTYVHICTCTYDKHYFTLLIFQGTTENKGYLSGSDMVEIYMLWYRSKRCNNGLQLV